MFRSTALKSITQDLLYRRTAFSSLFPTADVCHLCAACKHCHNAFCVSMLDCKGQSSALLMASRFSTYTFPITAGNGSITDIPVIVPWELHQRPHQCVRTGTVMCAMTACSHCAKGCEWGKQRTQLRLLLVLPSHMRPTHTL